MKNLNKKHLLTFFVLTVFGVSGFVVWNSVQGKDIERVIVENKTRSLAVESIKDLGENGNLSVFEVTVKNNYDKPITMQRFRISDDLTKKGEIKGVERGGVMDDWTLEPGETSTEKFSVSRTGKVYLVIAAVLFDNGEGDGDINDLTRLKEVRRGAQLGFQKIVPILRKYVDESAISLETVQNLEKNIEQIDDKDVPINSKRGFALAKSYVIYELQDIQEKIASKPDFNANAEITAEISKIETVLTKLQKNLPLEVKERRQK